MKSASLLHQWASAYARRGSGDLLAESGGAIAQIHPGGGRQLGAPGGLPSPPMDPGERREVQTEESNGKWGLGEKMFLGGFAPTQSDVLGAGGMSWRDEGKQSSIREEELCGLSLASECFQLCTFHILLSPSPSLFPPHTEISNWIQRQRVERGGDPALHL